MLCRRRGSYEEKREIDIRHKEAHRRALKRAAYNDNGRGSGYYRGIFFKGI